jgi:hypothetical protein
MKLVQYICNEMSVEENSKEEIKEDRWHVRNSHQTLVSQTPKVKSQVCGSKERWLI